MRKASLLAVVLVALVACAGPATAAKSPSPRKSGPAAASPKSPPRVVIVSLEAADTMSVRLVDLKGVVAAVAQFAPPQQPTLSNCADLLQPPVRIAGGSVYYADSAGVIRRMAPDGSVSQIATFALANKQQMLSFAVSPDETRLIGIVISTPPLHNPPPQTLGDPIFAAGTWTLDLETAQSGGSTTRVLHKDLGSSFPMPTVITGWDAAGPTATLSSQICSQAALPSNWYNGTLVHLGLDGSHLDRIGGSDCNAYDELVDGTVLCGGKDFQAFSVRRSNGTVLWTGTASAPYNLRLSPDGNGVSEGDGEVYLRNSSHAASFARTTPFQGLVLGWADAQTVVVEQSGHLGLATAADPLVFRDLGLTLAAQCLECLPYGVMLIGTVPGA